MGHIEDAVEPPEQDGDAVQGSSLLNDTVEVLFGILSPVVAAGQGIAPTVRRLTTWGPVRGVSGAAGRTLEGWRVRGKAEERRFLEALDDLIRRTLPGVIDAIFERIDVNDIIGRVDLNGLLGKVDLNAVMSRMDMNALMANVDFDAMMERIDFGKLADRILEEVDLRQIMRESSSSITSEAVDAVRVQGMNADRFVDRLVDRILFRRNGRDLAGPTAPPSLPEPAAPSAVAESSGGPIGDGQAPYPEEGSEDGDAGRLGVAASENEG